MESSRNISRQNDLVPGTIRLVELSYSDAEDTARHSPLVLIPAPTGSPNDPLIWSKRTKIWVTVNLLLWAFFANACIAWSSPAWALWVEELQTTFTLLSYGQAILVMMCGVGVLFLQPAASKFGRRLPYLLGSILVMAGLFCGLFMTRVNLFFAYMALSGFGSAPSYSTVVTSLLDISYLHQKGRMISIYGLVLIAGNFLPPLATGFIIGAQGWQWCFQYLLIFFGISTLLLMFTVEETSFTRTAQGIPALVAVTPPTAAKAQSDSKSERNVKQTSNRITNTANADGGVLSMCESAQPQEARYSYFQRMTLYRRDSTMKASYWRHLLSAFKVAPLPAPLWASIQLVVATFVVGVVMTTQASFFALPPYNFNTTQMGLMYIALLIGSLVGAFLGGPATDWLVVHLAKRNNGIHEPETRLWAFLPGPFLAAAGTLLWGLGADQGLHWIIPCLGLFLIGVYLNLSLPVALGYAFDCYTSLEDETAQLTNTVRNIGGGALTFCIQPWINTSGARNTTIIVSIGVFAISLTGVFFQIWGKALRRRYAGTYYSIINSY